MTRIMQIMIKEGEMVETKIWEWVLRHQSAEVSNEKPSKKPKMKALTKRAYKELLRSIPLDVVNGILYNDNKYSMFYKNLPTIRRGDENDIR